MHRDRENNKYLNSNHTKEYIADPKLKRKLEKREQKEQEKRTAELEKYKAIVKKEKSKAPVFYIPASSSRRATVSAEAQGREGVRFSHSHRT